MAQRRLRVPGLATTRQKVRQLVQAHRHVPRRLRRLRVGGEVAFGGFVVDAEESFRHVEATDGGLDFTDDAGDVAEGGVLLAVAPVAHGVLQRTDHPYVLLRRVLDIVLQGEGELLDGGAQLATQLGRPFRAWSCGTEEPRALPWAGILPGLWPSEDSPPAKRART